MDMATLAGILVTTVVMPAGGYIVSLGRRHSALEKQIAVIENSQTWIKETLTSIQSEQNTIDGKLDELLRRGRAR
jgi:hypothetical protein